MAIKVKHQFRGLALNNAYVRVIRIFGGKDEGWSSVVGIYADMAARQAEMRPIEEFNQAAEYVVDAEPYGLIYAALKARPEFTGAIDV